jgi:hypothetical protein
VQSTLRLPALFLRVPVDANVDFDRKAVTFAKGQLRRRLIAKQVSIVTECAFRLPRLSSKHSVTGHAGMIMVKLSRIWYACIQSPAVALPDPLAERCRLCVAVIIVTGAMNCGT